LYFGEELHVAAGAAFADAERGEVQAEAFGLPLLEIETSLFYAGGEKFVRSFHSSHGFFRQIP
jgi:hypothetical protein